MTLLTRVLLPLCQGQQSAGACLPTPPDPRQAELCLLEQEAETEGPHLALSTYSDGSLQNPALLS